MRLIDADKLLEELNNSHFPGAPYVDAGISIAKGKVCDAPTIDAIPVEWLKDKKVVLSFDHGVLVNWLIREWQLEQEAQDG